jgi:hypothetical protein
VLQLRHPEGADDPVTSLLAPSDAPLPNYRLAFPHFEGALPDLGEGWEDTIWADDKCPSLIHEGLGLRLWVDATDPEQRARPDCLRYSLETVRDSSGDQEELVASEDFEVIRKAVAQAAATSSMPSPG